MKWMLMIPTNGSGGAERVMSVVGGWLAEQGHEVCLVNLDRDSCFYPYPTQVKQRKLGVDYTGPNGEPAPGSYPVRAWRDFWAFDAAIRAEKPDGALVFLNMAESFGSLALIKNRVPFVVSIRNDPARESKPLQGMRQLVLPRCRMLVCQSEAVRRSFAGWVDNTCVIPNPLSPQAVEDGPPAAVRGSYLLNVGRLSPQKNQRLLLDAFALLAPKRPELRLKLVGGGALEQALKEHCRALGLTDRVDFLGREEAPLRRHRDAACFVLSSDFEGFPNVLVEAMANGIPCVSTDFATGAAREVITEGENGFLSPCGDAAALAEKLERLLDSPELQKKFAQAGTALRERYSRERVCAQWEQVLLESVKKA